MTLRGPQPGGHMWEQHPRLREEEQTSLEQECCRHVAEKARVPGWLPSGIGQGESGRRGGRRGCRAQADPTLASYSSATTHSFLSFSFLICKTLFTCRVSRGLKDHHLGKKSPSTEPTSNYHSLSTNYYHYYPQQHRCYVNLSIRVWKSSPPF